MNTSKTIATAIDFYCTLPSSKKTFWSRADTEQWYETLADTGFNTVYLRMSNGRAYWPSEVLLHFEDDGYNKFGEPFVKVCRDRDMLAEFVELAHAHGMKAIYWLPLYDDETTLMNHVADPEKAARYGVFPSQGRLGVEHPELYWEHRDAWRYPRDQDKVGDIMPNGKRRWWGGCLEYHYPEPRQYRLDLCREVVERYGVDGMSYNFRSHSWWKGVMPQEFDATFEYGFNQIVVDEYRQRHGVDIRTEDFDREKWSALRGEGVNQLVQETFEYLDGKGKELHMMINPGPGLGVDDMLWMQDQKKMFWGKLDLDWRTWIDRGWMHEGMIYGTWVRDRYGEPWQGAVAAIREQVGGRTLPINMLYRSLDPARSAGPMREDVPAILADNNLDGVTIYEADNIMWGEPKDPDNLMKILKDAFRGSG